MLLKIINKKSTTPGAVPASADLQPGEIAVNAADKKWFTKTDAGAIICLNMLTVLDGGEITIGGRSASSRWVLESREFSYTFN